MNSLTVRQLALLGFGVACAAANAAGTGRAEQRFLRQAAQENVSQTELARLAQSRARGADVKALAGRIVDERGVLGKNLEALAAPRSVTLTTGPDRATRGEERALASRKGLDFDRRYLIGALKALDREGRVYRKAAREVKDAEVRSFASAHTALIEQQLEAVRKVAGIAPPPPPDTKADEAPGPVRQ